MLKTAVERLNESLDGTHAVLKEVAKGRGDNDRLQWLGAQLRNIERQLESMLSDIETGSSVSGIGYFGDDDLAEMLDDLNVEISTLRGLIQTCLSLER